MKKATPPFPFRLAVYRWEGDFSRSLIISLQGSSSKIIVYLTNTTTFPSTCTTTCVLPLIYRNM